MTANGDHDPNGFRDPKNGRFLPGNPGGPGNPRAKVVEALRRAAIDAVEPAVIAGIMRKMCQLALEGNVQAATFVYDRLIGKDVRLHVRADKQEIEASIETGLLRDPEIAAIIERRAVERQEGSGNSP